MTELGGLSPAPFFIHVMKTAGGTFRELLKSHYGDQMFPVQAYETNMVTAYLDLDLLRTATPERHRQVRCYSGHYPYCAKDYVPRPVMTLTLLRDPVERVVSYLRHCKQLHSVHRNLSFEEIYEDPFYNPCFMHNHQVKVFSMVTADEPESVMDVIDVDDRRLRVAREHLASVEVIGCQEEFGEFLDRATSLLGITPGPTVDVHVGGDGDASAALRRRIADDNAADIEFYGYAVGLMAKRKAIA